MIQIAHRLETLLTSDVVHFIQHGEVVESIFTDDGSACQQLQKRTVAKKKVPNPEKKGETLEIVTAGFFRDLWDAAHGAGDGEKDERKEETKKELKISGKAAAERDDAIVLLKKRVFELETELEYVGGGGGSGGGGSVSGSSGSSGGSGGSGSSGGGGGSGATTRRTQVVVRKKSREQKLNLIIQISNLAMVGGLLRRTSWSE